MIFATTALIAFVFIVILLALNLTIRIVEIRKRRGMFFEISDISEEIFGHGVWIAILGVFVGFFAQIIWGG
ncbi:hypothetical protein M5X06_12800 [Paenibacillus alvei]|uniref:Uncharacterized protein n=1 Tax=Paenibacillus alvei TaxID=44250 RepID=A0ABT4GUP0_PAEAL|nr:hypothetical protein [Paenibacillus alvei]MCY9760399.1 hypothetical protein [Paenibacillus alvei]MCY9767691.1 hypothetical protein [Paenibacillus alvei]